MNQLREKLAPLTDWIPPDVLAYAPVEAWWLVGLVVVLLVLLLVGKLVRSALRGLWGAFAQRGVPWDAGLQAPLTIGPGENEPVLRLYQRPCWLRLIVLAPAGKQVIHPADGPMLLRLLGPNLEEPASLDAPVIRIWPGQLSKEGFCNTFHRLTPTGEPEGMVSNWVFLAGKASVGKFQVLLGIALWMREPCTLGRIHLNAHEWREALRLAGGE